jgi:long-chain fatty acid transport protein
MSDSVPGKITVVDFQWPETYGFGIAYQATPEVDGGVDVKHIGWSDVMKNFTMTYAAMGDAVTFWTMPQNWDDQTCSSLAPLQAERQIDPACRVNSGQPDSESSTS